MKKYGELLLVEGLDLAGKTTACLNLVARLPYELEHRRNALADSNPLYDAADEVRRTDSLESKYLGYAYAAAAALDVRLYESPVSQRIQESTIALRSLCHYRARGDHELADLFAEVLDDEHYPRIGAAVVLTASISIRRDRLRRRQSIAPDEVARDDLAVVDEPYIFAEMERIMVEETVNRYAATIIDTTELTEIEVVGEVARALRLTGIG